MTPNEERDVCPACGEVGCKATCVNQPILIVTANTADLHGRVEVPCATK